MKVKGYFLVVRTPDGIYDAQSIGEYGIYDEVAVEYDGNYVTVKELIAYAEKTYGNKAYRIMGREINSL